MNWKTLFEQGELPPEGEYEVIIEEAKVSVYSSRNQGVNLKLLIRPDIEQPAQGQELEDRLVDTPNSLYKLRLLVKAIEGLQEQEWNGLHELRKLLVGQPVRVYMRHYEDPFREETVARISRYMKGIPLAIQADDIPAE